LASLTPSPAPLVDIGRIGRAHGVQGQFWLALFSGEPARYESLTELWVLGTPYKVAGSSPQGKGLMLKLKGVDSREEASHLTGLVVQVPESAVAAPPPETFYHYQILGMRVATTDGRELGEVVEILETPGNDVYVTRGALGEVLLPAIADVVKNIDLAGRLITVEPVPGLLERGEP
jgi:16S rRNA processing protein RimM